MKYDALLAHWFVFSFLAAMTCLSAVRAEAQNVGGRQNPNDARALMQFKQMVAQRLGNKEDGFFVVALSSTSFEMTDPTNRRMVPRTSVEVYKVETRTAAVTSITNHMTSGGASNPRTPAKQDWRFVGRYEKAEQADEAVQQAKLKFNPQPAGRGAVRPR